MVTIICNSKAKLVDLSGLAVKVKSEEEMQMLFGKKKVNKQEVQQNQTEQQKPEEQQDVKDWMNKFGPDVRPGGVFMMQLLMKDKCTMPEKETMVQVLSKHLGEVENYGSLNIMASFAAKDYMSKFKDGSAPVQLMIGECDEFDSAKQIDDFKRSQMWDCGEDRDRILSECKYHVVANDMLGGGLPAQVRANMLMDYLDALLELYPQCEAVYFFNSGKLILANEIRNSNISGLNRFIRFAVNVRFFKIEGTKDYVIDTLGLSILFMEDQQYHFHDMDPNWVVNHAYNMASYRLESGSCFKNGDTIDGMADGMIVQNIQWKCRFEDAMIRPERGVIDVYMNEYAAGERN